MWKNPSGAIKEFQKRIRNVVEVDGCFIGQFFSPMASEVTVNWEKLIFYLVTNILRTAGSIFDLYTIYERKFTQLSFESICF